MNSFTNQGFFVLRKAIKPQTVKLLATQFRMMKDCEYLQRGIPFDNTTALQDSQVPMSYTYYSAYCFESLMLLLQPQVEKITCKKLLPCYTYARIMYKGAHMAKHKDRPACQYSVTACIAQDKNHPYPIHIENYSGQAHEVLLEPGDVLVYNGTELNHWREEYSGNEHIQTFLHYVDAYGPYVHEVFDQRVALGMPKLP